MEIPLPLLSHISGASRPASAVEAAAGRANQVLRANQAEAIRVIEEHYATLKAKKGRRPAKIVDIVAAGLPRFGSDDEWEYSKVLALCNDVVDACEKTGSIIASAVIHMDESSPHLHVALVPRGEVKGEIKYGLKYFRAALAQRAPVYGKGPSRRQMSTVQSVLYHGIGSKYGLARGKVGSGFVHRPLTEAHMAQAAKEVAESQQARAEAQRDQAVSATEEAKGEYALVKERSRQEDLGVSSRSRRVRRAARKAEEARKAQELAERRLATARRRAEEKEKEEEESRRLLEQYRAHRARVEAERDTAVEEKNQVQKALVVANSDLQRVRDEKAELQDETRDVMSQVADALSAARTAEGEAKQAREELRVERRRTGTYRVVLNRVREVFGMRPLNNAEQDWLETGVKAPEAVAGEMREHLRGLRRALREEAMGKVLGMVKRLGRSLSPEVRSSMEDTSDKACVAVTKEYEALEGIERARQQRGQGR